MLQCGMQTGTNMLPMNVHFAIVTLSFIKKDTFQYPEPVVMYGKKKPEPPLYIMDTYNLNPSGNK
jgi:hypothetical protein